MVITCSKKETADPKILKQMLPPGQLVNKLGNYLYKQIDGAYKYRKSSNMFDIWFYLYYQIPYLQRTSKLDNEMQEMTINVNITTYQNKIRVNVIECSPEEMTLGFNCYKPEQLIDLNSAKHIILKNIIRQVEKQ